MFICLGDVTSQKANHVAENVITRGIFRLVEIRGMSSLCTSVEFSEVSEFQTIKSHSTLIFCLITAARNFL